MIQGANPSYIEECLSSAPINETVLRGIFQIQSNSAYSGLLSFSRAIEEMQYTPECANLLNSTTLMDFHQVISTKLDNPMSMIDLLPLLEVQVEDLKHSLNEQEVMEHFHALFELLTEDRVSVMAPAVAVDMRPVL